jgi:L-threonylcarbamoyladenylate synthase
MAKSRHRSAAPSARRAPVRTVVLRAPARAAALLRSGQLVAFPTETVYGLGALALDAAAIARLFRAKGRPADNPLIVHIADRAQLPAVVRRVPAAAAKLMAAFWPGPLTLVLPRARGIPDAVTAGLDSVGVRLPEHPVALAFLRAVAAPVAAPSANRSGRPSPTRWQDVLADLDGRIAGVLRGAPSRVGLESTVVDCRGRPPVVLRPGAITLEQLRHVVPGVRPYAPRGGSAARSPGLRHRHYAPRARVVLVDDLRQVPADPAAGAIGRHAVASRHGFGRVRTCRSVAAYAQAMFAFFRACDAAGLRTIYCERVAEVGLGAALMDRLRRAAER